MLRSQSPQDSVRSRRSLAYTLNSLDGEDSAPPLLEQSKPSFWLVFGAICVTTFLSALDTTSFSTALPTIVSELRGTQFIWIGISYTMASTATLPMTGGLAQVFGRKPVLMGALGLFLIGSIVCALANHLTTLIIGRAIQGVGGGGISSLSEIIISDLVPLNKRGVYTGIVSAVWAFASAVGPPVGGAFSETSWRWLFYMNLPLTLIAFTLVYCFLDLKRPRGNLMYKLRQMDWIGSLIIIGSSSIFVVALSNTPILPWGLIPLATAIIGFFVFFWYEARVADRPTIPWELVTNRTSLSGYIATLFHAVCSSAVIFYMPVYFQSAKMKSPSDAGVAVFGSVFSVTPSAIICGVSVASFGVYRPQNFIGWAVSIAGFALLSTLKADSPPAQWVGFQIVAGIGLGFLYSSPKFAILAPLPLEKSANALAFFSFVRKFSGIWGITIGSTILDSQLNNHLPLEFLQHLEGSNSPQTDIAYASIPRIPFLEEPLRTAVRSAFADALRMIWLALLGVSGAGFLVTFLMKEIEMHTETDAKWGMREAPDDDCSGLGPNWQPTQRTEKAEYADPEPSPRHPPNDPFPTHMSTANLSRHSSKQQHTLTSETSFPPDFDAWERAVSNPWSPHISPRRIDPPPKLWTINTVPARALQLSNPPRFDPHRVSSDAESSCSSGTATPRYRPGSLQGERSLSLPRLGDSPARRPLSRSSTYDSRSTPPRMDGSWTSAQSAVRSPSSLWSRAPDDDTTMYPAPATPRLPHRTSDVPTLEIHQTPRWL
ncbi:hypothetical protein FRB99_002016 [Tulasnella sp. 403]|nr:hypothetical protein FRB99_002016 [Tulasnella sp. 403]